MFIHKNSLKLAIIMSKLFFTDLEPDDWILIDCVLRSLNKDTYMMFVVGEGDCDKTQLISTYLRKKEFTNYKIVQGSKGDKDYPKYFLEKYTDIYPDNKILKDTNCADAVSRFMTDNPESQVFSLMPIKDIMSLDRSLFDRCELYMYGSFNHRAYYNRDPDKQMKLVSFINSERKRTVLCESFFGFGENNVVTYTEMPELFNRLDPFIKDIVKDWNRQMLINYISDPIFDQNSRDTCEEYKTLWDRIDDVGYKLKDEIDRETFSDSFKTNLMDLHKDILQLEDCPMKRYKTDIKIIKDIVVNDYKEIVLGDFGLLLSLFENRVRYDRCRAKILIDSSSGFTLLSEGGEVETIKNIDRSEFLNFLTEFYYEQTCS